MARRRSADRHAGCGFVVAGRRGLQVYPRSFADSDGDGVGDLPGVISRLDYLAGLGVDAIWLSPFYPSPMADGGHDLTDHRDVGPRFGSLSDLDALLAGVHRRGLKVIIDLVPNHTSREHPWFQEAVAAGPGGAARQRYLFRDHRDGVPPKDWRSIFGGPAWTPVDSQSYLHLFAPEQPDLKWRHPQVIYRQGRAILDGCQPERIAVAEAWVPGPERLARYVRPDELHQAFNLRFLGTGW